MANSSSGESVLARAARVVQAFSPNSPQLSASQIARSADLSTSTAHRLCLQMLEVGLLDRLDNGNFVLGGRAWESFLQTSPIERLRALSQPILGRLHAKLRCYVALAIPDFPQRQTLNLDYRDEFGEAEILAYHGGRADIFMTSSGIALLAFGPQQWLKELKSGGPLLRPTFFGDPVETSVVMEQVQLCQERGYSHIIGGVVAENTAIAAPVWGPHSSVVAAVSCTILTEQADPAHISEAVMNAADELSIRITSMKRFAY
ncbi:helix-turn-helix domain-containing protein [Corynebacterium sp. 3HC-13]|uniref:IclR family transcriptional regulator n=1 Tax=Corynebacterium poyangense TaxID=2684405 RepID=UPI00165D0AC8|nr:helix-turn-helix domain-containing protein [Corynebacterium poyangense]MBZ8178285.1 helix-turn-helix domain-containing protein [Corynebacterium poyangense]